MAKFVILPVSKCVLNIDEIAFIGQVDINVYNVFFVRPNVAMPKIDGKDRDALIEALGAELLKEKPVLA